MDCMRMKLINKSEETLAVSSPSGDGVSIAYFTEYREGDRLAIDIVERGFYAVRLDEAMPEALLYLDGEGFCFPIPTGEQRVSYSPKAFVGACHVLTARPARTEEVAARRNLALNPYDSHNIRGYFPHATANVETRNEAVFAARNAIDGIFENASHGVYPYSSWGINRDPKAELKLEFGRPVRLDTIRLTLRADFPHDNWWKEAAVHFSDGSSIKLSLKKDSLPQAFEFEPKVVEWLKLGELIKSDEPSPFPALTQIEAFGVEA